MNQILDLRFCNSRLTIETSALLFCSKKVAPLFPRSLPSLRVRATCLRGRRLSHPQSQNCGAILCRQSTIKFSRLSTVKILVYTSPSMCTCSRLCHYTGENNRIWTRLNLWGNRTWFNKVNLSYRVWPIPFNCLYENVKIVGKVCYYPIIMIKGLFLRQGQFKKQMFCAITF